MLKAAVFTPIPKASESIATSVNPGEFLRFRSVKRMSSRRLDIAFVGLAGRMDSSVGLVFTPPIASDAQPQAAHALSGPFGIVLKTVAPPWGIPHDESLENRHGSEGTFRCPAPIPLPRALP